MRTEDVVVIGAGMGGLTLALSLHQVGIGCRVFEAAPELRPLGVGINLLPHACRELDALGMLPALQRRAVTTRESVFFNRFGQLVYREPCGLAAGYPWPQLSVHRGDLQQVLLEAVRTRLGAEAVVPGHRCASVEPDGDGALVRFAPADGGEAPAPVRGRIVVACDGVHSAVRRQLHPGEGPPRYSGVNMWRGVTRARPFLTGASMVRAGWLSVGKMVIYPIRDDLDGQGTQLVNWVAELEMPQPAQRDWNRLGRLEDFYPRFEQWRFDWLDVAALIRGADQVLEYPMVDQDPLPTWTAGRVTLLGDAAHPMTPRGSNGTAQAILDARFLAGRLKRLGLTDAALAEYDRVRGQATAEVVRMNRRNPPDAILREVHERSGDRPFARIEDVISPQEMADIAARYRQVSGSDPGTLAGRDVLP